MARLLAGDAWIDDYDPSFSDESAGDLADAAAREYGLASSDETPLRTFTFKADGLLLERDGILADGAFEYLELVEVGTVVGVGDAERSWAADDPAADDIDDGED